MAIHPHESKWRIFVGVAPLVGVVLIAWAATQGRGEVSRSPAVRGGVAIVAGLGALVAGWTARQRRVAPTISVARATAMAQAGQLAGVVSMRGRARALPGGMPLVSPGGELCVWFRQEGPARRPEWAGRDGTSVRPFLLVDDSGRCMVLPARAEVSGDTPPMPRPLAFAREPAGSTARERLLRDGDRIHVVGRFVPMSAEAATLQAHAAAGPGPALPVLTAPAGAAPFVIRIGPDDGDGHLFGLLAVVDGAVLVVAGGLATWSMLCG